MGGSTASRAALCSLLVAAVLGAAQVNIAPDAVTHATEGYNTYEGDLASLTDVAGSTQIEAESWGAVKEVRP